MTDQEIRITLRIPSETLKELHRLSDLVGLKHTTLFPAALVVGMHVLARQVVPQEFFAGENLAAIPELHRLERSEVQAIFKRSRKKKKEHQ